MGLSFGSGGGVQDPYILHLLAELSSLVKKHNTDWNGASHPEVVDFIEKHKDVTFIDVLTNCMHTFKEAAEPMVLLMQGFKNPDPDKNLPGDSWQKGGKIEDIFDEKDPDEPADWWKG